MAVRVEELEPRRLMADVLAGIDPGFGFRGVAATGLPTDIAFSAEATQPDGKVVLCGYTVRATAPTGRDFAVARLDADGTLDQTFGTRGITLTDLSIPGGASFNDEAAALALTADGDIIVVGTSRPLASKTVTHDAEAVVARYTAAGVLDPTFGAADPADLRSPGVLQFRYATGGVSTANAVLVQPSGEVVVAGGAGDLTAAGGVEYTYGVRWFSVDGVPDASHGNAAPLGAFAATPGASILDAPTGTDDEVQAMAATPDGGFALVGQADPFVANGKRFAFGIVKVDANGTASAVQRVALPVATSLRSVVPSAFVVQPNGKLLVAGALRSGTGTSARLTAVVARYDPAGDALDRTFGSGGLAKISDGPVAVATSIGLATDGTVTLALQTSVNARSATLGLVSPVLVRLTALGRLVAKFGKRGVLTPGFPAPTVGVDPVTADVTSPARALVTVDALGRATLYAAADSVLRVTRTAPKGTDVMVGSLSIARTARSGRPATGVTLTLTNVGTVAAKGPATVQVSVTPATGGGTTVVTARLTLALPAGQLRRVKLTFRWPRYLVAGLYNVTAEVLPAAKVGDIDAADNTTPTVPVHIY